MTKTFNQSFNDIDRLAKLDIKPLGAKLGKLMEEVGELAECVNIHQGYITHKQMKEPLVGEVADVIQNAIAILVDATPGMTKKRRQELLLEWLEKKNAKWESVQSGDQVRIAAQQQEEERPEEYEKPTSPPDDLERRIYKITSEQLGLPLNDLTPDALIVEHYGADSLDLVELVMAIEDEFEFEISDRDAERLFTIAHVVSYVRSRYGIIDETAVMMRQEDLSAFEESASVIDEQAHVDRAKAVSSSMFDGRRNDAGDYFDPAADYTERTGRHLSLEERMQERSRYDNK